MKKTHWDKISKIKLKDKDKVIQAFVKIVKEVQANKYNFPESEVKEKYYFVVPETDRMKSFFIHIVPKEAYKIFKELQKKEPHSFLGLSILCGKIGERDVRVSCFGVNSTELIRALISKSR